MRRIVGAASLILAVVLSTASAHATTVCSVTATTFSATEQQQYNGQVATFSCGGTVTATIDWGDGSPTSVGTVLTPSSPPSTITGTHTYAEEGPYTVTVTITNGSFSPNSTVGITVLDSDQFNPSPSPETDLTATQNLQFNGFIGSFLDSNTATLAGDLTATIDWGDDSAQTPGTISGSNGFFSVSGSHTFSANNFDGNPTEDFTVNVSLAETAPGTQTGSFQATVHVTSQLLFTNFISTVYEGSTAGLITQMTDAVLTDTAAGMTGEICWCDVEACETASIKGGNGNFSIYSNRLINLDENQTLGCVFVEVSVDAVSSASVGFERDDLPVLDAPISATPKSLQIQPNVAWTGDIGGFVDGNQFATSADYVSASINWGDGSAASAGTIQRNGETGVFSVIGTHTYATPSPAPYTATVSVVDVGGSTVTIKSSVLVIDTILKVTGATNVVGKGVASSLTAGTFTISDLGSLSTNFTASVDWGDGSTVSTGTVVGSRGEFVVSADHTYATTGTFTTIVTVTDTRGGGGVGTGNGSSIVTSGLLTLNVPASIVEYAGEAFNWTFTFDDAEAGATAAKYAISIDWGDATTASKATVTSNANGGFEAAAGHTYAKVGDDTITVTITDAATSEALAMVTIKASVVAQSADGGGSTTSGNSSSGSCSIGGVAARSATSGYGAALLLALIACAFAFRRRGHSL